jgi:hypothetical protein
MLGVGPDPRAALPSARQRSICYPQHSAGGRQCCHLVVRPLEKAIEIILLAWLMVLAYNFVFYDRNSTKMRHLNNLPWDDGSRRSPQCPPSHPSMALQSHPAQASVRTARPSGPLTHPASMGRVFPVTTSTREHDIFSSYLRHHGGGILSDGSSSDAVGTSDIIVSLDGSIF